MKEMRKRGMMQALGVVGYVALIATFMNNAERVFGKINKFYGPVVFLSIFAMSVLVCGLIVFYKPYQLFMDKKGKEAARLVLETTKWLAVLVAVMLIILFLV